MKNLVRVSVSTGFIVKSLFLGVGVLANIVFSFVCMSEGEDLWSLFLIDLSELDEEQSSLIELRIF